jgi:hypothetical protein
MNALAPVGLQAIQESLGWDTDEVTELQGGPVDVDILIGSDYYYNYIGHQPNMKLPSGLVIIPSSFGYLLGGKYDDEETTTDHRIYTIIESEDDCLYEGSSHTSQNIEEFWDLDTMGIKNAADEELSDDRLA